MLVYHVVQRCHPGHITSYRTGDNWVNSADTKEEAERIADLYNHYRFSPNIGLEYVVVGPMDETEEFNPGE